MSERRLIWSGRNWRVLGENAHGWARGYAFLGAEKCIEDDEILSHLFANRAQLPEAVASMNGCFAAVLDMQPHPVLISDRYGTIPVYIHQGVDAVHASDEPWSVIGSLPEPPELDELGALDMLSTGYVTGARTLIKGIETVSPATIVELRSGEPKVRRYWTYGYQPQPMASSDAERQLAEVLDRVARRTIGHVESRGYHPALTLSGGLDSRVLASTIAARAKTSISAISYGSHGDPEIDVAREVAGRLKFNHIVELISHDYLNDQFVERSVDEVGITTRFTCGIGARHLRKGCADLLIPGHTGDFISGGHLPIQAGMVRNREQLRHFLSLKHFQYQGSDTALRQILNLDFDRKKWETLTETMVGFDFSQDPFGLIDRWNVENRQRRLILMELRAYEKLGRWMLPFYDHELVDFFSKIPHDQRFAQNLYISTAKNHLFAQDTQGLSEVQRIGSRSMSHDSKLPSRIRLMQRIQPFSGWALQYGLIRLRDFVRSRWPQREQSHGTDPLKMWFKSNARVHDYLLQRVEAISIEFINTPALMKLLNSDGNEERIYNRLLPSTITIDSCFDRALETWRTAQTCKLK